MEHQTRGTDGSWNRELCQFYGSAKGCKWGAKCWDDHSNPNSVTFCARFNSAAGCSFGNNCYDRHQKYNTKSSKTGERNPRRVPLEARVTTQMELENALKVSNYTDCTPFEHPQNDDFDYPLPEIKEVHLVSIPLSCVPNHNETECQCQNVQRDEPEYGVSPAAPSTIIQSAVDPDTHHDAICNDSLGDRYGPKLVDAAEAQSILDPVTKDHGDDPLAPNLSPRSVLEKGTKCILCDLLFSSTMNGALCKVVGSYREDEDRYPVYVYKTKETALIKASNLKAIKTKSTQKIKRRKKAKPQKQALYHPVTESQEEVVRTLIFQKRNIRRVNSAKLFADTLIQSNPDRNLYKRNMLTKDVTCLLNGHCFYFQSFFNRRHDLKLFEYLRRDLEGETFLSFLDTANIGNSKTQDQLEVVKGDYYRKKEKTPEEEEEEQRKLKKMVTFKLSP